MRGKEGKARESSPFQSQGIQPVPWIQPAAAVVGERRADGWLAQSMHLETDISAFILTYFVFEEKAKEASKQSKMQQKSEDVGREV